MIDHITVQNNLNYDSVRELCGERTSEVMVYGWSSCYYEQVTLALTKPASLIKKIFYHHTVGYSGESSLTLQNKQIEKFPHAQTAKAICKIALVNIVYENFQRKKTGLPFIKIIFVVDKDDNEFNNLQLAQYVASRGRHEFTLQELRRVYKLCKELESGDLKEIAEVAQSTFVFVRLALNSTTTKVDLQRVAPFWEDRCWDTLWSERKKTQNLLKDRSDKYINWRDQLREKLCVSPHSL